MGSHTHSDVPGSYCCGFCTPDLRTMCICRRTVYALCVSAFGFRGFRVWREVQSGVRNQSAVPRWAEGRCGGCSSCVDAIALFMHSALLCGRVLGTQ